jgi:hypothetical protein
MPQSNKVVIEPRHPLAEPEPPTPSNLLRITGRTESPAERTQRIMRVIRTRTFGILSDDDLALVGLKSRGANDRRP